MKIIISIQLILYLVFCNKLICMAQKSARIMNGTPANSKQFPYVVSLQIQHTGQHFCGGALIDSHHVITAAHCMYLSMRDKIMLPAIKLQVRAGAVNLIKGGESARVQKVYIHENYESRLLDNDIAVLRLAGRGFQLSSYIQPVNLSTGFLTANNSSCTIIGWGRQCGRIEKKSNLSQIANPPINTTENFMERPKNVSNTRKENTINSQNWETAQDEFLNSTSENIASLTETFITNNTKVECVENLDYMLRYAKIPIQNSIECANDYPDADITDNVICAGRRGSKIDSCKGDSGGPLICNDKIEGIVSFGDGCDNWNHLGVYTRVYKHLEWINETINSSSYNFKNIFIIYFVPITTFIHWLINI